MVADIRPGFPPIGRFIDAALRSAAGDIPETAVGFPNGRIDDARILSVDGQVNGPRFLTFKQDPLPGFSAVGRAIDPSFLIRAEGVTEGGNAPAEDDSGASDAD